MYVILRSLSKMNYKQKYKDLDTRIIIGSFSDEVAPKIFCEVIMYLYILFVFFACYVKTLRFNFIQMFGYFLN